MGCEDPAEGTAEKGQVDLALRCPNWIFLRVYSGSWTSVNRKLRWYGSLMRRSATEPYICCKIADSFGIFRYWFPEVSIEMRVITTIIELCHDNLGPELTL